MAFFIPMPGAPLLRLILIQLAAASIVFSLVYLSAPFWQASVLAGVVLQGAAAAFIAWRMDSPRWWLPIHLLFPAALLLALGLGLNPRWYLAAFVLLLLVFWRTDQSRVPLYLSNQAAATAVVDMLPAVSAKILDIGCGDGRLLARLARARPDCHFTGIEHAPLPCLWAWLRCLSLPNVRIRLGDFWQHDFAPYASVYAFLSPAPMASLWRKASRELAADACLISNSFPVPDRPADLTKPIEQGRQTQLYLYKSPN